MVTGTAELVLEYSDQMMLKYHSLLIGKEGLLRHFKKITVRKLDDCFNSLSTLHLYLCFIIFLNKSELNVFTTKPNKDKSEITFEA